MINNVVLIGRLTRDLDLKYTKSGTAVGSFSVAVERDFKNAQGERETDFINCVIWRKAAENLSKFTKKGSLVGLEGKIQTRNYENNQGQRVYVTEVVVDNFSLLESRKDRDQNDGGFVDTIKQNNSFGNSAYSNNKQGSFNVNNNALEIDESDMPF